MKLLMSILMLATTAPAFAATATCQSFAEKIAVSEMNKEIRSEYTPPEHATADDLAQLGDTYNLDSSDEQTNIDTGVYEVTMGVQQECMDAMKVTTKMKTVNGVQKCTLIKVEGFGQRDCG